MAQKHTKPTDTETEILEILWAAGGEQTVRFVADRLNERREVGYTTALKMMQIMLEKGLLARRDDDRQHFYRPAVEESATKGQLVASLANLAFGGSAAKLAMQALGNGTATPDEIAEIKKLLDSFQKQ